MPQRRPTEEEINNEENEAGVDACEGECKYPGMSYADGVSAALRWVLGTEKAPPYTGDN